MFTQVKSYTLKYIVSIPQLSEDPLFKSEADIIAYPVTSKYAVMF